MPDKQPIAANPSLKAALAASETVDSISDGPEPLTTHLCEDCGQRVISAVHCCGGPEETR
jgi:hypothetical protein